MTHKYRMRDFLMIVRDFEAAPFTRDDLLESATYIETANVYGHWITPEGLVENVDGMHFQTLIDLDTGLSNADALRAGWIRVVVEEGFSAELYAGCITAASLEALRGLAEARQHPSYSLDVRWDDTIQCVLELDNQTRDALFESQCSHSFTEAGPFLARANSARQR